MLSILVPVYNQNVQDLVRELHDQALELDHNIEIICLDDGSDQIAHQINDSLQDLELVKFLRAPSNRGRAITRNILADEASNRFLLFLDGDSKIIRTDFLSNYFNNLSDDQMITGGRIVPDQRPGKNMLLHWKTGRFRESGTDVGFQSNNFAISKKLFQSVRFDQSIRNYGHEDTIFGYFLKKQSVPIVKIDNPVLHNDLQENAQFITNQEEALQNLHLIKKKYPDLSTRLTRIADILNKYGLKNLFKNILAPLLPLIKKTINSSFPSLTLMDIYKLGYYLNIR